MVKVPVHQTVYADYLYAKMEALLDRAGVFSLRDLADFAGLKVTGNMRRRVQHCVVAGTLEVRPALVGERGSQNVYFRPGKEPQQELPF